MPTWLWIPGSLALGKWSHHCDYLGHEYLLFIVLVSILATFLFLITSASVFHTISFLYCVRLCMKSPLGISNFLEEISNLSHSVLFLYFFALVTEEGFLTSSCYSLELCIQMLICFLFSSLLFTAICKASPDSHFACLHFFSMGVVLIPVSCTMSCTSSIDHQALYLSDIGP